MNIISIFFSSYSKSSYIKIVINIKVLLKNCIIVYLNDVEKSMITLNKKEKEKK